MFKKIGIVVSTAAGTGSKGVTKSLKRQLTWLGIPKVYRLNKSVNASSWETVPNKIKQSITNDVLKLMKKINKKIGKAKPNTQQKIMFSIMRLMQKTNDWNEVDKSYWEKKGWLGKKRPW